MEKEQLLDQILTYKSRIEELEQENKTLEQKLFLVTDNFKETIEQMPYPLFVLTKSGQVAFANRRFIELLDYKSKELFSSQGETNLFYLKNLVRKEILRLFDPFLLRGKEPAEEEVEMKGKTFRLSVTPISKGAAAIVVMKDLKDETILKEELRGRIEELIDQNMSMVQEIGFLLGEDTSKRIRMLNSMIEMMNK